MTDTKSVKYYDNLAVASSPHLVTALDTQKTMMWVLIALIPSFIASVFYFGLGAVILTAVCAVSSALFEWGYERLLGKKVTVKDLSACVTGVILAMNLPANLPVWMAVIGCFTAIVIVKQLYGGLGRNFANPAIVGRIVLLLSFTSYMTTWPVTRLNQTADALTGATPLGLLADGALAEAPSLKDMLIGNIGGAMGETCTIAVLIGLVILIAKKIISPIIPVCYMGTVFVFAFIYYSVVGGDYSALHMALFHLLAGGVVFGATFCATDYVTSPIMKYAKVAFGIGCGLVTMIIRLFCAYPEGASFAILFMNVLAPLLDIMTKNENFKEYGMPVVVLVAICFVTTLLLALTNSVSEPIIIKNQAITATANRKELLPDADDFTQLELDSYASSSDSKASVTEVYKANNDTGYVMTCVTKSFGGDLTMMVGLDATGAVTGVKVTDHADTPGVGTKDQDPEYLAQYISKTALGGEDVKKEAGFNFITGASVSGTAIHKGVYAALAQYAELGGAK